MRSLLLLIALVPVVALADEVAERADAALGRFGGKRVALSGSPLCDASAEPGATNRDFICRATEPMAAWTLDGLRADGGQVVQAKLEVRRFRSAGDAAQAWREALGRFGGAEGVNVPDGAISWCYLDVVSRGETIATLHYGCHISLKHVKALAALRQALLADAMPIAGTAAVAIAGQHSGWSTLIGKDAARVVLEASARPRRFARVHGVAGNDVLWLRESPESKARQVAKLPPDARCVPVVVTGAASAWWRLEREGLRAWAWGQYLEAEPDGTCDGDAGR
jgi:hypothetical protein